jgi:hypothetical protein
MTVAVYIIGSAITIVVLTVRLHETRHQLRQVTLERDARCHAVDWWLHLVPPGNPAAMPTGDGQGHPGLAQQLQLWPQQHAPQPQASDADRRPEA